MSKRKTTISEEMWDVFFRVGTVVFFFTLEKKRSWVQSSGSCVNVWNRMVERHF